MPGDECGREQFGDAPDVEVVGCAERSLPVVVGVSGDTVPAGAIAESDRRLEPGVVSAVAERVEFGLVSIRWNALGVWPGDASRGLWQTAETGAVTVGVAVLDSSQPPTACEDAPRVHPRLAGHAVASLTTWRRCRSGLCCRIVVTAMLSCLSDRCPH